MAIIKDLDALKELAYSTLFVMVFMYGLPIIALFLFGGLTEQDLFTKASFYFTIGNGFFVLCVIWSFLQQMYKDKPKLNWFNVLFFDPEQSAFGEKLGRKYLTFKNIILIGIVIGLLFSIGGVVSNTFFAGLPATEYQVTETGSLLLASEPASISETFLFLFPMSLLAGLLIWLKNNNKLNNVLFIASYYIGIPILVAIGWIGLHSLRYGGSDVSLIAVGFFGFMGALLTMLFGSILIWWIWHFINNLLQKASLLYSVDQILIGVGIFIVIFALFYFATWIIKVSNKQPVKS